MYMHVINNHRLCNSVLRKKNENYEAYFPKIHKQLLHNFDDDKLVLT